MLCLLHPALFLYHILSQWHFKYYFWNLPLIGKNAMYFLKKFLTIWSTGMFKKKQKKHILLPQRARQINLSMQRNTNVKISIYFQKWNVNIFVNEKYAIFYFLILMLKKKKEYRAQTIIDICGTCPFCVFILILFLILI